VILSAVSGDGNASVVRRSRNTVARAEPRERRPGGRSPRRSARLPPRRRGPRPAPGGTSPPTAVH